MTPQRDYSSPIIDSILHPTDFSEASLTAFDHALKIALIAKSRLTLLHVGTGEFKGLMEFPAVRETLELWGLLPKDSPRHAVPELGIDVRKVGLSADKPASCVLLYLEEHPVDLIVLAAHRHEGRIAWLQQSSVAKPIARRAGQATLFIPEGASGFVSPSDGSVSLKNILIPVAESPNPQPAIEAAARLATKLQCPAGMFTLLHIGDAEKMPTLACPEVPGWEWEKIVWRGDVIQGITNAARETNSGLVVMATDGRSGFLEALRGGHTERVLNQVPMPLLAVPVGSLAEARLESR